MAATSPSHDTMRTSRGSRPPWTRRSCVRSEAGLGAVPEMCRKFDSSIGSSGGPPRAFVTRPIPATLSRWPGTSRSSVRSRSGFPSPPQASSVAWSRWRPPCRWGPDATHQYRALVARANYLSMDRPGIGFASKECCRKMVEPSTLDWAALARLVRYLSGRRRLVYKFPWQDPGVGGSAPTWIRTSQVVPPPGSRPRGAYAYGGRTC